jgi:hypothetical protein
MPQREFHLDTALNAVRYQTFAMWRVELSINPRVGTSAMPGCRDFHPRG